VIAVIGGSDLNVSYMVGLAFAVAASATSRRCSWR
jgi:Na+(H+)/acetate symporter ActP